MSRLIQPKFHREFEVTDSDLIKWVEYDPNTKILDATLYTGEKYRYRKVPDWDFALFITAKSVGTAFNKYIKRDTWGTERKPYKFRT